MSFCYIVLQNPCKGHLLGARRVSDRALLALPTLPRTFSPGHPVTIPHARKRGVPPPSVKHRREARAEGVSPIFIRDALCRPDDPPPLVPVLDGSSRSLALG
jgi:hypothetical protein